jgi:hypothetical protein
MGPGSAKHHAVKNGVLHRARDTGGNIPNNRLKHPVAFESKLRIFRGVFSNHLIYR